MSPKRNTSKERGAEIRRLVVEMSHRSRSGETGSSLSISDLLAVLYFKTMRVDPKKPNDPKRDRFILSKGHGAAALYAALALRGFFPQKLLLGHRVNGGAFHGHPSRGAAPGIEASTGALGHGLSIGVGMAYALKGTASKVYVLIGDGECNEGSIWEAVLSAGALRLPNIVAVIDVNKFQGFGAMKENNPFDMSAQWKAFGWDMLRFDGHNAKALEKAFAKAKKAKKPFVVIADTIAGKGVPAIENTLQAHYYVPDAQAAAAARKI
jgi:transketolase